MVVLARDVHLRGGSQDERARDRSETEKKRRTVMLLTIGIVGMVVIILGTGFFLAARDYEGERLEAQPVRLSEQLGQSRFFVTTAADAEAYIPVELLLSRIEQHIRLEEAAVEQFVHAPERGTLYSQTTSTLVN